VLQEMECIFVERIEDVLREVIPELFQSGDPDGTAA
jgi:hypothetical protein